MRKSKNSWRKSLDKVTVSIASVPNSSVFSPLALERAEELKRTELNSTTHVRLPSPPREDVIKDEEQQPLDIDQTNIDIIDKRTKLTAQELDVLRRGSRINGRDYVPFFDVDLRERFAFQTPFVDPHGPLKLAPKQQSHFARWARPDEIMSEPKMIMALSYFAIKQDLISDCSFVASLAVSVQYEKNFNKRLITSIIYPQNKQGLLRTKDLCPIDRFSSLMFR